MGTARALRWERESGDTTLTPSRREEAEGLGAGHCPLFPMEVILGKWFLQMSIQ